MTQTPRKIWNYLGSLWGALSGVTILFPGVISLTKLSFGPNHSEVKAHYAVIPTLLSMFALLLLTSYRAELANLRRARRLALAAFTLAVLMLFGALLLRQTKVNVTQVEAPVTSGGRVTHKARGQGTIEVEITSELTGEWIAKTKKGDPLDILLLALTSGGFVFLTVAFGSLGINEYYQSQDS